MIAPPRLDPETESHGESVKLRSLVIDVASATASEAFAKNPELVVKDGPEVKEVDWEYQ